jgi:hypothetical protein
MLVGKPEGKRLLGRHRCRWEDNIKMDLREIAWEGVDWMLLAEDREQCRALVNKEDRGQRTEMVFETLVCSPLNHLTRLIARENFIILSRRESNKSQ